MPRYFFDVRDGTVTHDRAGVELADLDAARAMAVKILYELRQPPFGRSLSEQEVIVRTDDSTTRLKVMLTYRCVEFA